MKAGAPSQGSHSPRKARYCPASWDRINSFASLCHGESRTQRLIKGLRQKPPTTSPPPRGRTEIRSLISSSDPGPPTGCPRSGIDWNRAPDVWGSGLPLSLLLLCPIQSLLQGLLAPGPEEQGRQRPGKGGKYAAPPHTPNSCYMCMTCILVESAENQARKILSFKHHVIYSSGITKVHSVPCPGLGTGPELLSDRGRRQVYKYIGQRSESGMMGAAGSRGKGLGSFQSWGDVSCVLNCEQGVLPGR